MAIVSRREFLRTSGTVVGATMATSLAFRRRAGAAEKELIPKKLPFPPNDEYGSYEPTITGDGNTIYFARFAGTGDKRVVGTTTDIFVTHRIRQGGEWPGPGADWTVSELLPETVNSDSMDHEPVIRVESKLLDSIGYKCRVNAAAKDGLVLGVISVHDFGKFHKMVFVHYDQATKQWKGPLVEAPFNLPNVDGACPMFTADGDKMIWSSGQDRGPGPVSTSSGTGSLYDLFWLKTSDVVAYYRAKAGLS